MSKPEMIIKKVDEADITSLVLIARQTFDHTYRHLNDPAPVSYTHLTLPTIYSV